MTFTERLQSAYMAFSNKSINTQTHTLNPELPEASVNKAVMSIQQTNYRTRQDIKKWRTALQYAEEKIMPERLFLYNVYREIVLDNNLTGMIELRKERMKQNSFYFYDKADGEPNEEWSDFFSQSWFYELIDNHIESIFWGYKLNEILSVEDKRICIMNVNHEYIIPETKSVKQNLYDRVGVPLDNFNIDYLIESNLDVLDLGLLNKIVPIAIYKKNAVQNFSEFQEVFGQPLKVVKTSDTRPEFRAKLDNWLKNLGSGGSAIVDENVAIEFIQAGHTDVFQLYTAMIKFCDDEMSKLILGGSMVNSDGSSYSQSKTHGEQADIKTKSDMRTFAFWVNDYLIPKLKNLGIKIPEGCFSFDYTEKVDFAEQIVIDKALSDMGFKLERKFVQEKYNVVLDDEKMDKQEAIGDEPDAPIKDVEEGKTEKGDNTGDGETKESKE